MKAFGIPTEVWETKRAGKTESPHTQQWFERDTRPYRVAAIAHEWGLDPLTFLRLPQRTRYFLESFIIARGLKQEEQRVAQQEKTDKRSVETTFVKQVNTWEQEVARRFSPTKGPR